MRMVPDSYRNSQVSRCSANPSDRVRVDGRLPALMRCFSTGPLAISLAAATWLALSPTQLTPAQAAPKPSLALPQIETFSLANGLSVAVLPQPGSSAMSVQVWYRAGSKDEARDRRGSAHMFEHMMFKGTRRVRPEEHARHVNRVGGYANAETREDSTHYVNVVPPTMLDFTLSLEAERMRGLLFRKEMIDLEREVVKEEIRAAQASPIARGFERFLAEAYTRHPYAWTPGGALGDLDATTPADLQAFYDAYYQPGNALVVVVGDTTADAVKASVEKYFGAIPTAPAPPPRPADLAPEPPQTAPRRVVAEPSQIGLVLTGYKLPPAKHRDTYALQAASLLLGGGDASRLQQRIEKPPPGGKEALGVQAGAEARLLEHPGIFVTLGVFLDPASASAVEQALAEEVARLGAKGPSAEELRKAKNQIQAYFVAGLEDVQGIAGQIGESWILTGDPRQWVADLAEFEKLTIKDVQRVITTYLTPAQATTVIIPPLPPAAPAADAPAGGAP